MAKWTISGKFAISKKLILGKPPVGFVPTIRQKLRTTLRSKSGELPV
jgi:hypothetical protein